MIDYVYLAGEARSGSTFTEHLLANHPSLEAMGEMQKFSLQFAKDGSWSHPGRCGCGERPYECPIWGGVAADVKGKYGVDLRSDPFGFRVSDVGRELDLGSKAMGHWLLHNAYRAMQYSRVRLPGWRADKGSWLDPGWGENRLFVASRFAERIGSKGVIDNSKDCAGMLSLFAAGKGSVKVFWLTRDVRAVAASKGRLWNIPPGKAARCWARVNGRIGRVLSRFPKDSWMRVRYEDICADVEGACRRMCELLGYDYTEEMCEFGPKQHHSIAGDGARMQGYSGVRAATDKWKQQLSKQDVADVWREAGSLAEKLGYRH